MMSTPKRISTEHATIEVISLDGDDDEADDIIEEDYIEELSSNCSDGKNNPENDPEVMEIISLIDDEEEDETSDDDDGAPIGTSKISFLDPENRKIHKFIHIIKAEDENELIEIEYVSSDSDVEEVIDSDKSVYITIDPDDYRKVMKDKPNQNEQDNNKSKIVIKSPKVKKIKLDESTLSTNSEGGRNKSSTNTNKQNESHESLGTSGLDKNSPKTNELQESAQHEELDELDDSILQIEPSETHPESLKGPNIPQAICCQSCTFVCFKEEELLVHIALKHPPKADGLRTYTAAEIQELEREMKDQADECVSCGQALWYLPTLRAHAMIHPTGKTTCEACQHGTSVIKLLMDHLESHVGSEEEEDSDV